MRRSSPVTSLQSNGSPVSYRVMVTIPLSMIVAAGHMAKGLVKVSSWGGYLSLVLQESTGVQHAAAIASKSMSEPPHLFSWWAVSIIALCLIPAMTCFGVRESLKADAEGHCSRILPNLSVAVFQLFLVYGWRFGG